MEIILNSTLISIFTVIVFKDIIKDLFMGILFKIIYNFNKNTVITYNGKKVKIIKIGLRYSIFQPLEDESRKYNKFIYEYNSRIKINKDINFTEK